MFGFIKKKIGDASEAVIVREAQAFRQFVSVSSDAETGMMLVATAVATKHFKHSPSVKHRFPEPYLHGVALAETPEQKAQLSFCAMEMIQLHNAAKAADTPVAQLGAAGYSILVHSIRAVRTPQVLVEGRLIWRELVRGLPQYALTYREVLKPHASEEQIMADLFLPRMLVPDFT